MTLFRFDGRLAVVTGAADGIGAAISKALWAGGASLAAVDIQPVDEAKITGGSAAEGQVFRSYLCNATKSIEIAETCNAIQEDFGPVDILVNNVGGGGTDQNNDIETLTDDEWDFVVSLSLGATMRFSRGLVGGMKAKSYGRIVNISSSLKDGVLGRSARCAAASLTSLPRWD
ncbi:SDR family NAD(P)-dependent oxidoreductase [Xaviernesmea oryzae]|uniref:SDR family NAD(P)-dependent oxidoreductase n=1 Tax=Xaviernesmea oryzae TaxID=464029 RepID=UPI000A191730|nr:SDR family NAD(P)-dependent oxidoreductase [Xaviernesmea oryzae]